MNPYNAKHEYNPSFYAMVASNPLTAVADHLNVTYRRIVMATLSCSLETSMRIHHAYTHKIRMATFIFINTRSFNFILKVKLAYTGIRTFHRSLSL